MYQADKVDKKEYKSRHGAVIFDKKGNIISKGYNRKRFVPKLKKYGYKYCFLHSETDAIIKAERDDLIGSTLLVIRKGPTKLSNSKPCIACTSMICETGIKRVFYSNTLGDIEEMIL